EAIKDPTMWWSALKNEVPVLFEFVAKLMSIPASSVTTERN
ncbi:14132_t:CDS:1, partial [Entrophospora sp. SA101]